jgi:hypothetical protein
LRPFSATRGEAEPRLCRLRPRGVTFRLTAIAISLTGGCVLASSGCGSSGSPNAGLTAFSSANAATPSYTVAPLSSAQTAALGYPPQCAAGGETTATAQLNLRNLDPPSATSVQVAVGQLVAVSFPDPLSSQVAKTFPPSVLPVGLVCALGQPGNPAQGVHTILLRTLKPGGASVRWFRSGGAASSPVFTGYLQVGEPGSTTPRSYSSGSPPPNG